MTDLPEPQSERPPRRPGRWKRRLLWTAVSLAVVLAVAAYAVRNHVRTLQSLSRVPGTNCYLMDYYVDYHMDEIRTGGIDVGNVEDSFIHVLLPDLLVPIATRWKRSIVPEQIRTVTSDAQRCSTVMLRTPDGQTLFGRNLDYKHNACLILRVHRHGVVASVTVIDLAYLNLDRPDLEKTGLFRRLPLLFAPYYVQDGMNRHGVAVADLSVGGVKAPYDPAKPDVIHSTAMRLILDYAKTTDEAIELLRQYNVHFVECNCHLMIVDAGGASAVVEFIDGDLKILRPEKNWQVCTNHQLWGKTEAQNDARSSRYRTASDRLASLTGPAGMDDVMEVMRSVSRDGWTTWSSVYNLSTGEFRVLHRKSPEPREYQGRIVTER